MSHPPQGESSPWEKHPTQPDAGETQIQQQPQFQQPPPQYQQPQYQQPQYQEQPQYGQPQYGQQAPQYGQPQPQFGQPQPQYGQQYQPVPAGYFPVFNAQGQQVLVPLASPGKRFGCYLLDALLVIITLVIGYIIWMLFTWRDGQTPGKKLLNMKYVNTTTGQVADWGKSAFRDFVIRGLLVGVISSITIYIGFLIMAFMIFDRDKNYQAGWDRIAGTVVVDTSNVPL
jgi:hypothetical protein